MRKILVIAIAVMGIVIAGFATQASSQPQVGLVIVVSGSGGLVPPTNP